jgi:hypothetical protein
MHHILVARAVAPWVCLGLLAGPLPARAEETITCSSHGFGYRYCQVDTDDRVELVYQRSYIDCREGRSWGYDRHGVWVDHGCAAEFRVGNNNRSHARRNRALVAGAALVGLAALAAMSANKKKQEAVEVEAWAVGTFTGKDTTERADVELSILPGGSVSGHAGRNEFTGSFKGTRLEAGRHVFQVERSGNGFIATDEKNPAHRVVFQRSDSGGY